jgi:ribosomal protein S18 acetylase RimI-like enzyme
MNDDSASVEQLTIRRARPADIGALVALARQAAPARGVGEWTRALTKDRAHPQHLLVVAEVGGELAAYGRASRFDPATGSLPNVAPAGYYLTGVFVHPARRRAGVASALTESRLDWIRACAGEAWFFANARNLASIELHRRFGFREVTRRFSFPGAQFDGGEGILFRADLTASRRA